MSEDIVEDSAACQALAVRLEEQLRAAKSAQLACGEVLLPADLLPRVARDVLRMAENEPCGLRCVTCVIIASVDNLDSYLLKIILRV